ncbi:MAG TPA: NUDIX domain-containing protein [Candidatus Paceibacterota bacterium]|nr:NUDIX domain-containing protein [Candidatus Paceibacterota bacterium]
MPPAQNSKKPVLLASQSSLKKNFSSFLTNKKEQKFKPRKEQVDFTHIRWAPVINCVLKYKNKILLVQRSKNMRLYPEYWNGISGFLDDDKSLEQKVWQELKEEVGLAKKNIISIHPGIILNQDEPKYKKTWIVHPVLVNINTEKIKLDWEAQNYQWVTLEKAKKLKLLPGFDKVLFSLFA